MRSLLLLALALAGQDAHVHPGYAACYDAAAWVRQQALYEARDLDGWNRAMERYREAGVCWLTREGAAYELAGSDVEATVRIRPAMAAKGEPPRWAYISVEALGQK